jgi:hypothetical protein
MIDFRSYLTEGKDAPLYHGSLLKNLIPIIKNGLKPDKSHDMAKLLIKDSSERTYGVSFTRDYLIARRFVLRDTHPDDIVILQYNQRKLIQKYKIFPVDFWSTLKSKKVYNKWNPLQSDRRYFEAEEYIITKTNIPSEYLDKVYISKNAKAKYFNFMDDAGIEYKTI